MAKTTKAQGESGGSKAPARSAAKAPAKSAAKASAKSTPKAPAKSTASKSTSTATKSAAKDAGSAASKSVEKAPVKKAASSSTKAEKPAFDKKFLAEQKAMLLEERARYVISAETLKAEADALVEGREPGDVQFDEESGEGDTLAVERERDLALSAHARAAVEEIDAALARLEAGTYGICLASGKPIPKERLQAIPWASERVEYKAGGFGITR